MSGMKSKTIKLVLKRKVNDWLNSIDDSLVKSAAQHDCFVTGGAIASMLLGEKINDYDIYFKTRETALAVAEYYVKKFNTINGKLKTAGATPYTPTVKEEMRANIKGVEENRIIIYNKSAGVAAEEQEPYQYFEMNPNESETDAFMESLKSDPLETAQAMADDLKPTKERYRPVFLTENAITLSDGVQLVVRFYGEPSDIHVNYDFAHTTCYYIPSKDEIVLDPKALECLLSKSLVYRGSLYPLASLFRIRKFLDRGWKITAGQMLKMVFQLNSIDLNDRKILYEQLIGVDMAYMSELLRAIKESTKDGEKIDSTYLAKLIDTIFDESEVL